jgi:hypothetical protein
VGLPAGSAETRGHDFPPVTNPPWSSGCLLTRPRCWSVAFTHIAMATSPPPKADEAVADKLDRPTRVGERTPWTTAMDSPDVAAQPIGRRGGSPRHCWRPGTVRRSVRNSLAA